MEYRNYKDNELKASILGFGGWQLGSVDLWGGTNFEDGVLLVREAVKKGVNFFDTAPGYANGLSEKIIGEAVKDCRNKVIINTKFGHTKDGSDFRVESIEKRILESCQSLQTNYLDSLILHNPEKYILEGKTDHFKELQRMKDKGLIKAYGVSVDTLEELELIIENIQLDVIEVMFNIIHQDVSKAFDELKRRNISLIIKVPFDSGWLTGKYNENSTFTGIRSRWDDETKEIRSEIVQRIKKITNSDQLVKYALSFIKSYPAVTTIIPGIKNIEQLNSNITGIEYNLSDKTKLELNVLYADYISKVKTPW